MIARKKAQTNPRSQADHKVSPNRGLRRFSSLAAISCLMGFNLPAQALPAKAAPAKVAPAPAQDPMETFVDQLNRFSDPNPASFSFLGTGRLQIPSLHIDIGSNVQVDQVAREFNTIQTSFNQLLTQLNQGQTPTAGSADALKVQLDTFLNRFEQRTRVDYQLDSSLVSFAGHPLAAIQLGNRPLALGLSLGAETRGFLNAQFSDQFNQSLLTLTSQLPEIFNTGSQVAKISSQAGSVVQQVNGLTTDLSTLTTSANNFFRNPSTQQLTQLTTLLGKVNTEVTALTPTARDLVGVVKSTSSGARNLLGAIKTASGGGIQVTAANDLHLTLGVGGSYPVFENDQFKISVGAQAKLFMVPINVPVRSLSIDSNAGLLGKLQLTEISGITDTKELEATLDTFDKAVTSVSSAIDQAEKVSANVAQVQTAVSQNNLASLTTVGTQLVQDGQTFTTSLTTATRDVQAAASSISGIQSSLINQLSGINAKGTLTTPDGAGFGLDLGVDAVLWRQLRLGLQLQNPLVLWQGTETPFEGRLLQASGSQIAFKPTLDIKDSEAKKVAYNATVPLAVLFNAQYRFDDLLPTFPGFYATGLFEYVNNGRTPALTLGVQKQWDSIGYAGLGTRLGGVSTLVYLEGGLRPLHGFGLDLQFGFSPGGNGLPAPGMGWLGLGQLGMYWQF